VARAGGLVGEFSGLLTTHMLIFACRVCSDASYCCSSPAIGRAILRGGEIGGGWGCRVGFFFFLNN